MKPIGYVRSPFMFKNGTPRQATVCRQARAQITVEKTIFNNPEHSLEGLENFTHVWIVFIFHKNNNTYTKAKVKPPRLNGVKVGLFSTRSPYRPNAIGLTLAKIESVKGATITVSGIDILDGTPVVDLKPYIPEYDCPLTFDPIDQEYSESGDLIADIQGQSVCVKGQDRVKGMHEIEVVETGVAELENVGSESKEEYSADCDTASKRNDPDKVNVVDGGEDCLADMGAIRYEKKKDNVCQNVPDLSKAVVSDMKEFGKMKDLAIDIMDKQDNTSQNVTCSEVRTKADDEKVDVKDVKDSPGNISDLLPEKKLADTANWIKQPPISKLCIRFTPSAEESLRQFSLTSQDDNFRLHFLKSSRDAREAIINILQEDPRSTYRRKHCVDSLYYFTVDVIHVTCWFDDDVAEIVRLKPAVLVDQCKNMFKS